MTKDKLNTESQTTFEEPKVVTEDEPVTYLRPVVGGKGPPGTDWLSDKPAGTVFCVQDKRPVGDLGWVAHTWEIVSQNKATTLLFNGDNGEQYVRVIPKEFCKRFDLLEIDKYGEIPDDVQ